MQDDELTFMRSTFIRCKMQSLAVRDGAMGGTPRPGGSLSHDLIYYREETEWQDRTG